LQHATLALLRGQDLLSSFSPTTQLELVHWWASAMTPMAGVCHAGEPSFFFYIAFCKLS
jgi:hypothetical protein